MPLHSAPLDPLTLLDTLLSYSFSSGSACTSTSASDFVSESVSAALAFALSQSIPFWYHHRLDTLSPPSSFGLFTEVQKRLRHNKLCDRVRPICD